MNQPHVLAGCQAIHDFAAGCSPDENPYPEHSHQHGVWQKAMERYHLQELIHETVRSNSPLVRKSAIPES